MNINPPKLVSLFSALVIAGVINTPAVTGDVTHAQLMQVENSFNELELQNIIRDPHTETSFEIEIIEEKEYLPYETEINKTEELLYGEEEVVQKGEEGVITRTYEVSFWSGREYGRRLIKEETQEPVKQIIKQGTRKVYKDINTPEGTRKYFDVIEMWSTSYDGTCPGCTGTTYMGTPVEHGVCAVDPSIIPLGSEVFVPGYGVCTALDIGGAIQGKTIDLGFEDVQNGWWSSRYTDVYLLK